MNEYEYNYTKDYSNLPRGMHFTKMKIKCSLVPKDYYHAGEHLESYHWEGSGRNIPLTVVNAELTQVSPNWEITSTTPDLTSVSGEQNIFMTALTFK